MASFWLMESDRHQLRIIRRAIDGDAEAFADLGYRYVEALYRYLYFRLGSVLAAEEASAQVMVRVWETLPTDSRQEVMPFTAWLFLVANEVVIERAERYAAAGLHPARPPKIIWSDKEKRKRSQHSPLYPRYLAQAVMQLDEVSQQVILLRFVLRLSHHDTGLVVGDSSTGSRVLQYRALLELREQLTRKKMSERAYASDHVGAVTFCLDRIISGRWTADDCLEYISDDVDSVEPLLRFAVLVREAITVRPRKAFGKELRQQIPSYLRKSKRKPVNRPQLWRWVQSVSERIPAPVVAACMLGLILFAGAVGARSIAVAVDSSAPGDRLYDLDLRLERAYRTLVTNPETRFLAVFSATEERLVEAEKLAQRGDVDGLQVALVAYSMQVAELTEPDMVQTGENNGVNLDRHFANQQQRLDKIYTTAFSTLMSNESGEVPEGDCDVQTGDNRTVQAVGLSLAAQYGVDHTEIANWVCDGHTFGEIVLALSTVDHGAGETVEVMELKSELGGWGRLWQHIGSGAVWLKSDDENAGSGGESQRPPTRVIPPTRTAVPAAPTPEITPSVTATPHLDDGNSQDDEAPPTIESGPPDHAGPPDGVDPPGGGPPDHAGPPDGVDPPGGGPPDHAGPPDGVDPPGGGPPDHAGPPDGVDPPGGGPPDDAGPPGGGPPGNSGNDGNPGRGRP